MNLLFFMRILAARVTDIKLLTQFDNTRGVVYIYSNTCSFGPRSLTVGGGVSDTDDGPVTNLSKYNRHTRTHTHTHARTHAFTHAHTHAHTHTHTHTNKQYTQTVHTHTHTRTRTHTHTHTHRDPCNGQNAHQVLYANIHIRGCILCLFFISCVLCNGRNWGVCMCTSMHVWA